MYDDSAQVYLHTTLATEFYQLLLQSKANLCGKKNKNLFSYFFESIYMKRFCWLMYSLNHIILLHGMISRDKIIRFSIFIKLQNVTVRFIEVPTNINLISHKLNQKGKRKVQFLITCNKVCNVRKSRTKISLQSIVSINMTSVRKPMEDSRHWIPPTYEMNVNVCCRIIDTNRDINCLGHGGTWCGNAVILRADRGQLWPL